MSWCSRLVVMCCFHVCFYIWMKGYTQVSVVLALAHNYFPFFSYNHLASKSAGRRVKPSNAKVCLPVTPGMFAPVLQMKCKFHHCGISEDLFHLHAGQQSPSCWYLAKPLTVIKECLKLWSPISDTSTAFDKQSSVCPRPSCLLVNPLKGVFNTG